MIQQRKFFLQIVDEGTDCPIHEQMFSVEGTEELSRLVDPSDPELKFPHDLTQQVTDKICKEFGVNFDADGRSVRLRPWHAHDELPYKVHTGRELLLMLQGQKPLSVFCYSADVDSQKSASSSRTLTRLSRSTRVQCGGATSRAW